MKIDEIIEVLQALKEGKALQRIAAGGECWLDVPAVGTDGTAFIIEEIGTGRSTYRLKPRPGVPITSG